MKYLKSFIILIFLSIVLSSPQATWGQDKTQEADDTFLLTILLKHDQSKTLDQIQEDLKATGFWAKFPPDGIDVESWYVMMGIGQVVTIRVPPERLREVNRIIEQTAWGAFRTEFYATYDLSPVAKKLRQNALSDLED